MNTYKKEDFINGLKYLGIVENDIVYVSTNLFQLGKMEEATDKHTLCQNIFDAIKYVIGVNGTIIVPTFTPQTARYGEPFVLEETRTNTGIFSEFVRTMPGTIRSLHPISSIAGQGKYASIICKDIPPANWCIDSSSYRMYKLNAKSITIGANRPLSAWGHLLETMYGVPYLYNKLLDVDVFAGKQKIDREFFASVCYLDYDIIYDFIKIENMMKKSGAMSYTKVGCGTISCISGKKYFEEGLRILNSDPYVLLKNPPNFRHGEIPFDGITENREKILSRDNPNFHIDEYKSN